MGRGGSLLDDIRLTYPCPVSWEGMEGDERVRFCAQCRQKVYNLSELSRTEAEAIVRRRESERVCIRFYRRTDGTVVTRECPLGAALLAKLEAGKRRLRLVAFAAVALLLAAFGWLGVWVEGRRDRDGRESRLRDLEPFKTVLNWVAPEPPPPTPPNGRIWLGW